MQDADTSIGQSADENTNETIGGDKIKPKDNVRNPVSADTPSLCIECKHIIPVGAVKCKECNSFQDWRRFLVLSGTALSLIVALVSVSGIVVPILIETLSAKEAFLTSAAVSNSDGNIFVLVANSGAIDGYVGAVSVLVDGSEIDLGTQPFSTVKASSSLPIELSLREDQRNFVSTGDDCKVHIHLLDHMLQDRTVQHDVPCAALR